MFRRRHVHSSECCHYVYNYQAICVCPFDCTTVTGSGKVGFLNFINHTGWVTVVAPTDRPKSVINRYVIEHFEAFFTYAVSVV